MAQAIQKLAEKSYTYENDGSIYYRIAKFPEYGKLSHSDFSGMRSGARVDVDEYEKADARDFVLWKAPKDGEPFWDTELGPGRPGWHIECSVMAIQYLGETLDIHAGGVDLIFPHHENEIAQVGGAHRQAVRAVLACTPSSCWSKGRRCPNRSAISLRLRDILAQGHQPEAVRYLLASVPYRKALNFTFDGLKSAATAIERLRNYKLRLETRKVRPASERRRPLLARTAKALEDFAASLDDDLNTAAGAGRGVRIRARDQHLMDAGEFSAAAVPLALALLDRFDSVFDVLKPAGKEGALSDDRGRCAGSPSVRAPRKPRISPAPIASARNCWIRHRP